MKYLFVICILAMVSTSFAKETEQGKHLFILSGQSNMGGLDPTISFTPTVEAEFGKDNVIVVKKAWGSKHIARWDKKWTPSKRYLPISNDAKINLHRRGSLYDSSYDGGKYRHQG